MLEPSEDSSGSLPWWHPRRPADVGGRTPRPSWERLVTGRLDSPWTVERIAVERGRLLRRLGRNDEAVATWLDLAGKPGAVAIQAWIEVAKLREHRLGDRPGALDATGRAIALAERRRRLGRHDEAVAAWLALASGPGSIAVQAWIEVAKLREHRLADLAGALDATRRAAVLAERRRRMGLGDPLVERALATRLGRLRRRTAQPGATAYALAGATSGSRGSGSIDSQVPRTQSRSGSNEQAIVRRSPARAFR